MRNIIASFRATEIYPPAREVVLSQIPGKSNDSQPHQSVRSACVSHKKRRNGRSRRRRTSERRQKRDKKAEERKKKAEDKQKDAAQKRKKADGKQKDAAENRKKADESRRKQHRSKIRRKA